MVTRRQAVIAGGAALFFSGTGMTAAFVRGDEQASPAATSGSNAGRDYERMVSKAIEYLRVKGQATDGSFSSQAGPGVTALVVTALLRHGRSPDDPFIAKSLKYIEQFIDSDGGLNKPGGKYRNYETCLAILAFKEANKGGRYDALLKKADGYVKSEQWDEGEGKDKSDPTYGGSGYGSKSRPDLSNTSFLVEALKATGNKEDSEAIQRALVFISRCQNLESEHNTTPFAAKNPDGGFYYTPAAGGESMAGKTDAGGLRSYGSMTYAGLKSMIYAGVGPEDPRVKAAVQWIQKNYDVRSNPGMGDVGLFYYYHTFSKALDAIGQTKFKDAQGVEHDWKAELRAELAKLQREDGAWVNKASRWMEGDANLVTAYALLALAYAKP
ncbi:MAG: prenyltransferase/squalene oxidase repeat-containing protein [Pirellulales bacterium]